MSKEFSRRYRVSELLQRELAVLVQRHTQSADTGIITISNTDISPDLKSAKIFITCLGNNKEIDEIVASLNNHAGQFQHALCKVVALRVIPKLRFEYDFKLEQANKLSALIDSLHTDVDITNK